MSDVIASGIDMGNMVTLMSVFQTNETDPLRSAPVKVADRNGSKEPSYGLEDGNANEIARKSTLIMGIV